ncbi:MAG: hypothetical protein ACOYM3_00085 [Terrimicrobiaceae bacterium]
MNKEKVSSVAKQLGISTQAVYKKLAKLGNQIDNHLVKENGVTYLTNEGVEILRSTLSTKQPDEFATVNNLVATIQKAIEEKQAVIEKQHSMIEKLIANQAEERQRTDTIIMKLAYDLEATRKSALAIEAKVDALAKKPEKDPIGEILKQPAPKVEVWTPPAKTNDPLVGMSWLQKVYVQFIEPWRMRQFSS